MDGTVRGDHARRVFLCKSALLYWTGDYPAQSKVSCHHDKVLVHMAYTHTHTIAIHSKHTQQVCHWCTYKSQPAPEINRRKWGEFRRWLPNNHPYRHEARFGDAEVRGPPALRTHAAYVADGTRNASHTGKKMDAPYKETGIYDVSPLVNVPLFNIVWDVLADVMHTVPRFWKGHMFPLFRGVRTPSAPRTRKTWTDGANKKLLQDHVNVKQQMLDWTLDKVREPASM